METLLTVSVSSNADQQLQPRHLRSMGNRLTSVSHIPFLGINRVFGVQSYAERYHFTLRLANVSDPRVIGFQSSHIVAGRFAG